VAKAPADTGFILCDDPWVIVPPYGGKDIGVGIPGAVKYFPLSRLFCLRIGDTGQTIRYRKIDKEKVAAINKNIAANSERFVMGPDRAQLETVVNDSGSQKMDLQPRHKVFLTNQTDGGSLQVVTTIPGRYFYVGGALEWAPNRLLLPYWPNILCPRPNGRRAGGKSKLGARRPPGMYADEQVILGRERKVFPMPSSLATVIASIRPNQHVRNECVVRLAAHSRCRYDETCWPVRILF
jgi:hypothetical protein